MNIINLSEERKYGVQSEKAYCWVKQNSMTSQQRIKSIYAVHPVSKKKLPGLVWISPGIYEDASSYELKVTAPTQIFSWNDLKQKHTVQNSLLTQTHPKIHEN